MSGEDSIPAWPAVPGGSRSRILAIASLLTLALPAAAASRVSPVTQEQRQAAETVLRGTLEDDEGTQWVQAAERLFDLDLVAEVAPDLEKVLEESEPSQESRIRAWEVLAKAASDDRRRVRWIEQLSQTFLDAHDESGKAAVAASLARLRHKPSGRLAAAVREAAHSDDSRLSVNARWVLSIQGASEAGLLLDGLSSELPAVRAATADAIRQLPQLSADHYQQVNTAAEREPQDSPAKPFLIAAAAVHAPPGDREKWLSRIRDYQPTTDDRQQLPLISALADLGAKQDVENLMALTKSPDPAVRMQAAHAVLKMDRRSPHRMEPLDWLAILLYCLLMLGIGVYYSVRSKSTEDYLLGGRQMNPIAVGISLFATLLSTISYLSWPGEMIRYGPIMMLGCVASYPLIALVVGWFMIPFIMRLRVTTAYELLDAAIGGHVRLLGSVVFLLMRLTWMAVIIYVSASKLLAPLLGLGPSTVPTICAILGVIVVIYTSMGGIRAVVLTDVLQTLIMVGGGFITIGIITYDLGGVGGWWPTAWPAHWPEAAWAFEPHARTTFLGTFVGIFTWYVCVSCSDQMTIQRYLSTRDVRAARMVLVTSLGVDALVTLFLGLLGLPLLAYFRAHPHLLQAGRTILNNPDELFPQFMVFGLPAGLTGVLAAGLLSAAMSSLSSGVNSSCSVIVSDLLRGKARVEAPQGGEVTTVRLVSVVIGVVVVFLSTFVGMVQGNLMEIAFKLVNLFAAPLAGIFLMAMFVKRSNPFGTYVGFIFGLAMVTLINFWEELTGVSFIWAMPLGLLVQVSTGTLASYLTPSGQPASPCSIQPDHVLPPPPSAGGLASAPKTL